MIQTHKTHNHTFEKVQGKVYITINNTKLQVKDINAWLDAVYEQNEHWKNAWRILQELTDAQEKKTGASLTGSQMLTETQTKPETSPPLKS